MGDSTVFLVSGTTIMSEWITPMSLVRSPIGICYTTLRGTPPQTPISRSRPDDGLKIILVKIGGKEPTTLVHLMSDAEACGVLSFSVLEVQATLHTPGTIPHSSAHLARRVLNSIRPGCRQSGFIGP
jgi:hypothetical protein